VSKKTIRVACAIIEDAGKVLATQRNTNMSMPLKWEFPGGKLHIGESPEECLARELEEELGIGVTIRHPLPPVHHRYEDFFIELIPFVCTLREGTIVLFEHRALAWLSPHELSDLDWPEADIPVIASYRAFLEGQNLRRNT
jgi:8-oxo-dGTP diphosphatase